MQNCVYRFCESGPGCEWNSVSFLLIHQPKHTLLLWCVYVSVHINFFWVFEYTDTHTYTWPNDTFNPCFSNISVTLILIVLGEHLEYHRWWMNTIFRQFNVYARHTHPPHFNYYCETQDERYRSETILLISLAIHCVQFIIPRPGIQCNNINRKVSLVMVNTKSACWTPLFGIYSHKLLWFWCFISRNMRLLRNYINSGTRSG